MLHDACISASASPLSTTSSSAFSAFAQRSRVAPPPDDEAHGEVLSDFARARIKTLAKSEAAYAVDEAYINNVQTRGMTTAWRDKISQWFSELGDAFDMRGETVAIASNYLDRYLSRRSCESTDLQLAATASVFLASKVEEQRHFKTGDLVSLCGGLFTRSDLRLMELELMMTLQWRLNPPTVHAFVHYLAELVPSDVVGDRKTRRAKAKALAHAERARVDYAFLRYPPSLAAVAAVVCGLREVGAPLHATETFVARVSALGLPYQRDPEAPQKMQDCGLIFLEFAPDSRDLPRDEMDEEVEDHNSFLGLAPSVPAHGAPSPTDIASTHLVQQLELADVAAFDELGDDRSPAKKPRYH